MQRWLWLFVLAMAGWSGLTFVFDGSVWVGMAVLVVGAGLGWWISPWRGGRTIRHADVQTMPAQDKQVVVYWRPGCQFCARLRLSLGASGKRAVWVNIWQDREAAEFVRTLNDGNETVPTVLLDGEPFTNPEPALVKARLGT
ncbi:MAG: glutaredoxin domain-containing protein [Ornithinimicrobium sp.]